MNNVLDITLASRSPYALGITHATRVITRLVSRDYPANGKPLPAIEPVCDDHALAHVQAEAERIGAPAPDIRFLPRAIEDEHRFCAACVREHGYTYVVDVSLFRESGKFADHVHYLTTESDIYAIVAEARSLTADRRSTHHVHVSTAAHPGNYPTLIPRSAR